MDCGIPQVTVIEEVILSKYDLTLSLPENKIKKIHLNNYLIED